MQSSILSLNDRFCAAFNLANTKLRDDNNLLGCFRFGDLIFNIIVDGTGRTPELLRMISDFEVPATNGEMSIQVFGLQAEEFELLKPPVERRSETILLVNESFYYLWLNEAGGYLTVVDKRFKRGLVVFSNPRQIASWHVARPFLPAFRGFSSLTKWTPIHAASVSKKSRALLFVGLSGAGKSSLAMACFRAGWDHLGDDAVLVHPEPATVAAIYQSVRLRTDMFSAFSEFMTGLLAVSDDAGEKKAEIDLGMLRHSTRRNARVAGIIFLERTGQPRFRINSMGRSEALRRLMIVTRQSMLGDENDSFRKLGYFVEEVPSFVVDQGSDLARAVEHLEELICLEKGL